MRLACWAVEPSHVQAHPLGPLEPSRVGQAGRASDRWCRAGGTPRVRQGNPDPVEPSRVEAHLLGPWSPRASRLAC